MIAKDVGVLGKVPRHVAVILDQKRQMREYDADEMVRRAVDVATWCACAGISIVTLYEPTGTARIERTWELMCRTLEEGYQ
jgi:dehydrodolichyl diphosphate syntase complex subunit NUS1